MLRAIIITSCGWMIALIFLSIPASADTTYVPSAPNGKRIYLSQACHDPELGTNCSTNFGCDGYSENARSAQIASALTDQLVSRGYRVRIGDRGVMNNVAASNAFGSDLHVPLHTNGKPGGPCKSPGGLADVRGVQPQYRGPQAREVAEIAVSIMSFATPGSGDFIDYNTSNYENSQPNAVPAYMEFEYHDWGQGVEYLRQNSFITGMRTVIESCFGYPRQGQGATTAKQCSWT